MSLVMSTGEAVIHAEALTKAFAGNTAVDEVTLTVEQGALVGLIGPNGSGKTTTLNLLNGALRPDSGSIIIDEADLAGCASTAFVRAGVARTFQNPTPWKSFVPVFNATLVIAGDFDPSYPGMLAPGDPLFWPSFIGAALIVLSNPVSFGAFLGDLVATGAADYLFDQWVKRD